MLHFTQGGNPPTMQYSIPAAFNPTPRPKIRTVGYMQPIMATGQGPTINILRTNGTMKRYTNVGLRSRQRVARVLEQMGYKRHVLTIPTYDGWLAIVSPNRGE